MQGLLSRAGQPFSGLFVSHKGFVAITRHDLPVGTIDTNVRDVVFR